MWHVADRPNAICRTGPKIPILTTYASVNSGREMSARAPTRGGKAPSLGSFRILCYPHRSVFWTRDITEHCGVKRSATPASLLWALGSREQFRTRGERGELPQEGGLRGPDRQPVGFPSCSPPTSKGSASDERLEARFLCAIRRRRLPGPDRKGLTNCVLNRLRKRRGRRSLAGSPNGHLRPGAGASNARQGSRSARRRSRHRAGA